jgi:peptidoglycan hydrolase-like protein with peptidoglycan-binding domain
MIKKIVTILIVFLLFVDNPIPVFAERLITNPALITLDTAPHSAKPKAKKSTVRNLKLGMKGNDVLILQKFLIKKATGPAALALAKNKASGNFGQLTKDALIEFQKANGLAPDGIAGAKVKALYNK